MTELTQACSLISLQEMAMEEKDMVVHVGCNKLNQS